MVILLTGPDTFRSQRRFIQLRDAFRERHDNSGLSTVSLDGQTITPSDVRQAVTTQGFFSAKRFIGINRYDSAVVPGQEIEPILKPVIDSKDVIVVIRQETKPAGRPKKGMGRAKRVPVSFKGATVEEFSALSGPALQKWINDEVRHRGGQIVPTAVQELMLRTGTDLWRLDQELDKLVALAQGQAITIEHVTQLVPAPEVTDVFALTDAVGQRRTAQALHLLENELAAGTHPLALIALLANHISTLLTVQKASQSLPAAAIAAQYQIHPYVVQKALGQTKQFSQAALTQWHHQLIEIDLTLKSTPLDATALLEVLLARG